VSTVVLTYRSLASSKKRNKPDERGMQKDCVIARSKLNRYEANTSELSELRARNSNAPVRKNFLTNLDGGENVRQLFARCSFARNMELIERSSRM